MNTTQERQRIGSELAVLNAEELALSAHCTKLRQRIGVLNLGAPLGLTQSMLLNRLEDQEIDVSAQQRGLHRKIDWLREIASLN